MTQHARHMLRLGTLRSAGRVPGQPRPPVTDPERIRHRDLTKHTCGWCGGPNSHHNRTTSPARVLCRSCMRTEFGSEYAYDRFIRSERARRRELDKRRQAREAAS